MLIRDADGKPEEFVGTWSDITERKNAEETLRLSEARYRSLYDGMMDAYVSVDMDGRIRYFNQSYQKMTGYEAEELCQLTYQDLTPEKWHTAEAEITEKQVIGRGYSNIYEKEYARKDGSIFPVELRATLIRGESGKPAGMWALIRDISERKLIEETLRLSEARYRNLYEGMMDAFASADMGGLIQECNPAYEKMLGYETEELHNLTYVDLTPGKWHEMEKRIIETQVLTRGYSEIYEKEYIRKDGTVFPVELRTELIRDAAGNPTGTWAIVRDISERKISEQSLRESEARYRDLLDASMQGVFVFQDQRIVYNNQAVTDSFGYGSEELRSFTTAEILTHIHPDDRQMVAERLRRPLEIALHSERYSLRIFHKTVKCAGWRPERCL